MIKTKKSNKTITPVKSKKPVKSNAAVKTSTPVKSNAVVKSNKDDYATDLSKHGVQELILWRNTASKRVDVARAQMEALHKKYNFLNKKAHSDIKWIRRLHNELSRQVFGHRPHIGKPFEKVSPLENKIGYHMDELAKLTALHNSIQ